MDVSDRSIKSKEEAAAWLLRLESGTATRPEREAFVEWLRESPLHVAEMLRLTNVHDALASFERWDEVELQDASPRPVVVPLSPQTRYTHPPRRTWPLVAAVAVSLVAVLIGAVALWDRLRDPIITTERGERREITLADGSVLQIDPNTTLRVRFEQASREIGLERGRAVFKVAKNPRRPFVVKAEDTLIRAIGTSFGVERGRAGVRVTVVEGKVAVSNGLPLPDSPGSKKAPPEVLLTANQQVTVPAAGPAEAVRAVNSERELAWSRGQLVFEKASVAAVVDDFNRYNQVQLHVADASLAQLLVSGVFDASDPESFIAFLQSTAHIRVTRSRSDAIELTSSP
jgi:transmembrane sensor